MPQNSLQCGLLTLGASAALVAAYLAIKRQWKHKLVPTSANTNIRSYLVQYDPVRPFSLHQHTCNFVEKLEGWLGLTGTVWKRLAATSLQKSLEEFLLPLEVQPLVINVVRNKEGCLQAVVHVTYAVAPAEATDTKGGRQFDFASWGEAEEPRNAVINGLSGVRSVEELKHVCKRQIVDEKLLFESFQGVLQHYHEQQLQEYSRYKNWRQSCYMEVHKIWTPQAPVTDQLYQTMKQVLQTAKAEFAKWYAARYRLQVLEVETLNSFITKYIPVSGKDEFGKHIDGAKIDGSLILALPTDEPHDWPGLIVWDGPKDVDKARPDHAVVLRPGDACFLDKMVWHHGLPITKGARYVMVCFYKCNWKKIRVKIS